MLEKGGLSREEAGFETGSLEEVVKKRVSSRENVVEKLGSSREDVMGREKRGFGFWESGLSGILGFVFGGRLAKVTP